MPRFKARLPPRFQKHKHYRFGKWSNASSRSGTDDDYDIEKSHHDRDHHDTDSDISASAPSSPTTSDSYAPMLSKTRTPTRTASAYQQTRIDRTRCNRYFTFVLLAILVIFILTLTRASHKSREEVQEAPGPASRPPLYESFPFLERYNGGIKTLVSRSENKAEYPDTEMILEMLEGLQNASASAHEAEGAVQSRDTQDSTSNTKKSRKTFPTRPVPLSRPFNPFNDKQQQDSVVGCFLDADSKIPVPHLHAYDGGPGLSRSRHWLIRHAWAKRRCLLRPIWQIRTVRVWV